ncbi:MAG TPA: HAD family phosphatase [Mycobacteriales bacterium]|nr:HAD family phosphatase [Mycobacteriales bacterium]
MTSADLELPSVVVFDLGGVLADFGGLGPLRQMSGIESDEELWRRWLTSEPVRRFESGLGSDEEFAAALVVDWQLPITPDELLEMFPGWLVGAYDGAVELVRETAQHARVACFSNSNRLHWEAGVERWPLLKEFDRAFVSFEIGAVKPDPEAFEIVVRELAVPASRTLFLDDNQLNVDAALSVGMRAQRVRGVDGARAALVDVGLLSM